MSLKIWIVLEEYGSVVPAKEEKAVRTEGWWATYTAEILELMDLKNRIQWCQPYRNLLLQKHFKEQGLKLDQMEKHPCMNLVGLLHLGICLDTCFMVMIIVTDLDQVIKWIMWLDKPQMNLYNTVEQKLKQIPQIMIHLRDLSLEVQIMKMFWVYWKGINQKRWEICHHYRVTRIFLN